MFDFDGGLKTTPLVRGGFLLLLCGPWDVGGPLWLCWVWVPGGCGGSCHAGSSLSPLPVSLGPLVSSYPELADWECSCQEHTCNLWLLKFPRRWSVVSVMCASTVLPQCWGVMLVLEEPDMFLGSWCAYFCLSWYSMIQCNKVHYSQIKYNAI